MVSALIVGTNTYQLQAAANTLLGDLIYTSAWEFLPSATKDKSLITAFLDLQGEGLIDPGTGLAIDPSAAPTPIKQAQAELAFVYSQDPESATQTAADGTNVKSVKAGSAQVQFFAPVDGTKYPKRILALIKPYLPGGGEGSVSGSHQTGACDASAFNDNDELLLNRGYA